MARKKTRKRPYRLPPSVCIQLLFRRNPLHRMIPGLAEWKGLSRWDYVDGMIRRQLGRDARAMRAELGVDPDVFLQLMQEEHQQAEAARAELQSFLDQARGTYKHVARSRGYDGSLVDKPVALCRLDPALLPGLDGVADELAAEFPQAFIGHGDDLERRLFDLLAAGNPGKASRDEARERVLTMLRECQPAEAA
jgi:hypothetical protein